MSMEKYYTPTEWENYPSEDTAINAMRLNHAEDGINELDDRIVELSTDKSEVDWNQILLSGEKIAEITINGIKKNVYTSNDSAKAEAQAYKAEGYATGEQNGIPVESGSPYYHNNSKYFSEESASHAEESSGFADDAEESSFDAEAWAVGERDGVPVPSTDPTYNNNAKYYASQAQTSEGLLASGDVTLHPDMWSSVQVNIPQGLNIPLNPTLVIATDTDYEVVSDISWRGTTSSGTLQIDFSGSPTDVSMTVNYKVYYKKS